MPKTNRPASPLRKVFGENLRATRKAKALSIFDIAYAIKMDWSYISQIERGGRNVGLDVMDALAGAVDVPLVELLRSDYQPEPSGANIA